MGSSVKLVTKDELTTGNYFNADNLIGGENTTIVKDGDVYKINAAAGESATIESSDRSITVKTTTTGYDLTLDNGRWQKALWWYHESPDYPYTVDIASNNVKLRAGSEEVGMIYEYSSIDLSYGDIIMKFGGDNASGTKFNLLSTAVYPDGPIIFIGDPDVRIHHDGIVYDKNDNEIFGLTSDNAGDNITITGEGSTLKINAAATVSYPHITDSDNVTISVNGSSNTFAFTADNISSLNTLIANRESYLTQNVADGRYANKTELNYKQDQLTSDNAGNNITITGSGSTLKINAEATVSYPHISDSDNVIISAEGTSDTFSFTSGNISALNTLVSNSGNYLTQSTADTRYAKTTDLSNKQDQLTSDNAGDNITITGEGSALKINAAAAQYESGDGISIENNIISIRDNGITSDKIANGAITADKITDGTITSDKIANGSITGDEIADGSIGSIKLSTAINSGRRLQLYYFK